MIKCIQNVNMTWNNLTLFCLFFLVFFNGCSSCFVSQLEKHKLKCNARPQQPQPYIQKDINVMDAKEEEIKWTSLSSLTDDELVSVIQRVTKIHSGVKIHMSIIKCTAILRAHVAVEF